MKILYLTQLFPFPPVCGGTIRSHNIIKHLGRHHDLTMVSFVRRHPTAEQMDEARSVCREVLFVPIHRSNVANLKCAASSLLCRSPFIVTRDSVETMRRLVDDLVRTGRFDLIYVDHLQMAQYVVGKRCCPKVLDEHNVEWRIIERVAKTDRYSAKGVFAELEWRKLQKWELQACEDFDMVLTVTYHDRQTLCRENPKLKSVRCLPIGVDFDCFPRIELRPDARDIVSIGTMSWPPNIDAVLHFARSIYPDIRRQSAGVRFVIAGSNPPASIEALAKRDDSVEVTGFVKDIADVASRAAAFVVPLRSGSGMRVKILNAMAMGLPVVTTSVGCEGIGAEHKRHLLIADGTRDFADAVVRLLSDFDLRKHLGEAGRQFAVQNYGWDSIYARLDEAIDAIASGKQDASPDHATHGPQSGDGSQLVA
jgi:glycosyltransferase involved in cell wall biosynthesis